MSPRRPESSLERILIIRPTALGDVSRSVAVLTTLRQAHPQAQIDWLVAQAFADVIRHHPAINHLILFPRARFGRAWRDPAALAELLRWCRELRTTNYDLVVDLQGLFRSGLFTWLTRSPRRLGFAHARECASFAYNQRYDLDRDLHAVDRMIGLVAAAGYDPVVDMRLYTGEEDETWWAAQGLSHEGYVVIAPTARWRCKCWPIGDYVEITKHLRQQYRDTLRVVVLAHTSEQPQIQPLLDAFADDPAVTWPRTTVGQMMTLLRHARLLICNDSAALHIAVGFDRPIVTIFGPTDPSLVGPYQRLDTVIQPPDISAMGGRAYRQHKNNQQLISRVDVHSVWEKILWTMNRAPTPSNQHS